MSKNLFLALIIVAALTGITSMSSAITLSDPGWQNITVYDGFRSSDHPWYNTENEDNEVEDHVANNGSDTMSPDQDFDLEAVFYNNTTGQLAIIGGYDFAWGEWPRAGDIFVTAGNGDQYVMDVDYAGIEYTIGGTNDYPGIGSYYEVGTTYDLYSGAFNVLGTQGPGLFVPASGPWRYDSGGVQGTGDVATYYHAIDEAAWGVDFAGDGVSDYHNVLVLDAAWLGGIGAFSLHNTMEDGGDVIHGQIPEPATLLLFGLGLLGVAGINRKKQI